MKAVKIIGGILAVLTCAALFVRYGTHSTFAWRWLPGLAPAEPQGLGDVGPVVKLEPFMISDLQGGESVHVTSVTFEVEVGDEPARDAMKSYNSQIRSAILSVLADARLSDLGDPTEDRRLKKIVQERIQAQLPGHQVRHVYITDLITY